MACANSRQSEHGEIKASCRRLLRDPRAATSGYTVHENGQHNLDHIAYNHNRASPPARRPSASLRRTSSDPGDRLGVSFGVFMDPKIYLSPSQIQPPANACMNLRLRRSCLHGRRAVS